MKTLFRAGQFSVPGVAHRSEGRESQDSAWCEQRDAHLLMLVSDGVGAEINSKVGSVVITQAVRSIIDAASDQLVTHSGTLPVEVYAVNFTSWLDRELKAELEHALSYLGVTGLRALCATIVGAFVTDSATVVFGCGDGVIGVNGKVYTVSSARRNRPELPVAQVAGARAPVSPHFGHLRTFFCCKTAEVSEIVVGTDGASELMVDLLGLPSKQGSPTNWLESQIRRGVSVETGTASPWDDATLVGAWRKSAGNATAGDSTKGG